MAFEKQWRPVVATNLLASFVHNVCLAAAKILGLLVRVNKYLSGRLELSTLTCLYQAHSGVKACVLI